MNSSDRNGEIEMFEMNLFVGCSQGKATTKEPQ